MKKMTKKKQMEFKVKGEPFDTQREITINTIIYYVSSDTAAICHILACMENRIDEVRNRLDDVIETMRE